MPIVSGADILVNRGRADNQSDITVTTLADGGWVVTWRSEGLAGSGASLHQQAFHANGSFRGSETKISTASQGNSTDQQVTALKDGGWMVTWAATNLMGNGADIRQRIFNANGTARTDDEIVSGYGSPSSDRHANPHVTMLKNGDWVTTWSVFETISEGWNPIGTFWVNYFQIQKTWFLGHYRRVGDYRTNDSYDVETVTLKNGDWAAIWVAIGDEADIFVRLYRENDQPYSDSTLDVRVNGTGVGHQYGPEIARLANGGFVVTWVSQEQDGSGTGVYQQAFNASGAKLRGEVRVNGTTAGNQDNQKVTELAKGGWVVTWVSQDQDGSGAGIYQKVFNADGSVRSGEARVNSHTPGDQYDQQVAALRDGGWVVVWSSRNDNGTEAVIRQQVYKPDGTAFGREMVIRTKGAGVNQDPQVMALKDGGWAVTWQAHDDDGNGGQDPNIHQKIFSNGSAPVITSNKGAASARIALAENNAAVMTLKGTDA